MAKAISDLSLKIIRARQARRWSMPELAKRAKLPKSLVWRIETNAKANPCLDSLKKIAKSLDMHVRELL
jgi:transcriptional regulator with XRE-family HTH domain